MRNKLRDSYLIHKSIIEFEAEINNEINVIKEKKAFVEDPHKEKHWEKRYKQIEEFDKPEDGSSVQNRSSKELNFSPYTPILTKLLTEGRQASSIGEELYKQVEAISRAIWYYKESLKPDDESDSD